MQRIPLKPWAATLILAVPTAAVADGLRTTINAKTTPAFVERWAPHSMCVDLRADDSDCELSVGNPNYQVDDPDCRTEPYDPTDPEHTSDYAESEAAFWAAVAAARTENPSILIGTYLSGQRVQTRWDDYLPEALPKSAFDPSWIDEVTGQEFDNINITIQAARDDFAAQIIAENQSRNQAAAAQGPSAALDILYLDNIIHPSSLASTYNWDHRVDVLSQVKTGVNADGQLLIANVALNQAHLLHPDEMYGNPPGVWSNDLEQLWNSVDGMSVEIPYHPNARVDAELTRQTLEVYRRFLDGDPEDPADRKTLVFIALLCCGEQPGCLLECDDPELPPGSTECCGNSVHRDKEVKLIAGFAMTIYEPGDKLYVALADNNFAPEWDDWTTAWGEPLDSPHVFVDANNDLMITRPFANGGILEVNVTDKVVVEPVPTKRIAARWDDEDPDNQPQIDTDFVVDATDPDAPSVTLQTGRSDWRIWSHNPDNLDGIGDIGTITTPVPENFSVKLARPDGTAGARNVSAITLVPTNPENQSNLLAAFISGAVDGEIAVQADLAGNGGVLHDVTLSAVSGNITANSATGTLVIDDLSGSVFLGQSSAAITLGEVSGSLEIGGDIAAGVGAITIAGDVTSTGGIAITGDLDGDLAIQGTFSGSLCAANLDGAKPLPPHVQIPMVGAGAAVCTETADCANRPAAAGLEFQGVTKNRFISLAPGSGGTQTAIAVLLDSLHHPPTPPNPPDFSGFEYDQNPVLYYVNAFENGAEPVFTCVDELDVHPDYPCARLGSTPEYRDWGNLISPSAVLHVTGGEIVPSSRYHVFLLGSSCPTDNWASYSPGIVLETPLWGNIDGNEYLNIIDIGRAVDTIKNFSNALPEHRALIHSRCVHAVSDSVNVLDLSYVVDAMQQRPYPFSVDACSQ